MNEVKQVLRLRFERELPVKAIARQLGISRNTVKEYIRLFEASKVPLDAILAVESSALSSILRPEHATVTSRYSAFLAHADMYLADLKQHKHLTKLVLWEEEFSAGRTQYRYSQFCHYLQQYEKKQSSTLPLQHAAADRLEIDFAGDKLYLTDPDSGKLTPCEVLVMTLSYSKKTFVIALPSQRVEDLIVGVTKGLEFFGALPSALVVDNLKSAVTKSDRFEPTIQESFLDCANHYGLSVLPARVRKPRDKSSVEGSVNHVYAQVYGRMRKHLYYSFEEINRAILGLTIDLNNHIMKGYGLSREALYQRDEKALMRPLPEHPYQLVHRQKLKVAENGHIYLGKKKQHYSVPYQFIGQRVTAVITPSLIKVYLKGECVATHPITGIRYTTDPNHLASQHKAYLNQLNPDWFLKKATEQGEAIGGIIQHMLNRAKHPEQNYKSCQGVLSLKNKYPLSRVEQVCKYALEIEVISLQLIRKLCENPHFDDKPTILQTHHPVHANIRGAQNYH